MAGENTKVFVKQGGDELVIGPGGKITFGNMVFTVSAAGVVVVTGLPTTEPAAVGGLYTNSGVLTISNGP